MGAKPDISGHYTSGALMQRLRAALAADGADPARPSAAALQPYDQFHSRGIEATEELAALLEPKASYHLLDVGSGIGGPARHFARVFGCRVTGIDLTAEFCDAARELTRAAGQDGRVSFHQGDALKMPFADRGFDAAYSMNVSMNIADKAGLYREIDRVLKPGALLALSELARGAGPAPEYPTPWAATAAASFLSTPDQTRRGLEAAGFAVVEWRDTLAKSLDYGARSRAAVERGEKPPHRAVMLIHGALAPVMAANVARGLKDGGLIPIEVLARKA